ncbi:MAG: fused MFS/spermidine synthase [Candidatus Aminicenantes bacterium]|nr:fused MFS/spermidine synthase [Candidatus Aminicenantes bacterium]
MNTQNTNLSTESLKSNRFFPLLLVMFFGSGCAALIYEVVWFQLLQLVIGSTAVSLAVLLGTYMGGMSLGSIMLPRLIPVHRHPLRIYAFIEMGIGISGLAILFGMPVVVRFYSANAGSTGILMRGLVCAACLLLPTMLMGATLPAIGRWIDTTPQGISKLGWLYGSNIAGAVFGCLLAAFYLLRIHDTATATFFAVAVNAFIALLSIRLAARFSHHPRVIEKSTFITCAVPRSWPVYITIALSGFCALGAEVIWTRLLSLMLGATVYTFAIILAVFLTGLGIGSGVGASLARRSKRPRTALGLSQLLLTAAIAWTAFMLTRSIPYWTTYSWFSQSTVGYFLFDFICCVVAVLPAACLWGASFPLALAAVSSPGQDGGRLVGRVYASNTVGAIFGAILFSLLLIPALGTQQSHRLIIGLSFIASLLVLVSAFRFKTKGAALGIAAAAFVGLLVWTVPDVPWELIAYGRYLPMKSGSGQALYVGEGMNASVAVTETKGGTKNFHISGRVEASSSSQDMRMQRMLGHIPALLHSKPRSVLVVGCGAGVTAGSFVLYPEVERIVICEIEKLIPQVVAKFFGPQNYFVLDDPRVEVIYDDARHYILTSKEKFDVITTDPIHPWIKGSASLYTKEYLELVKRHLNPEGIIVQWVPLYESTFETVQSEIATFFDVFPSGSIWSNDTFVWGYDMVLLGKTGTLRIDVDALQQRLDQDPQKAILQSLSEVGFRSALELLATYTGQACDLTGWLAGAEINRDKNLRLQYMAGMGINSDEGGLIFEDLVTHGKYPEDLFVGSEDLIGELRYMLGFNRIP